MGGVVVAGRRLHSLFYPDDVVMIADSAQDLQTMIDVVDTFCAEWRMDVNVSKSKLW